MIDTVPGQLPLDFSPRDPRVTAVEAPRLNRQSRLILERLLRGPASNTELATITHRFGARIHDLRKHYAIELYDRCRVTGTCWYRLSLKVPA